MIALQKKIVVDENRVSRAHHRGAQFCESSEALGLDMDEEAVADLRATREDLENGDKSAFTPLSEV